MLNTSRKFFFILAVCAVIGGLPSMAAAGTIIKLNLGSVAPDVEYVGGVFSTADDGDGTTPGDQNTAVEYTDFLETEEMDINTAIASFSMDGLVPNGQAQVIAGVSVIQNFNGGNFTLWAPDNSTVLLQGTLASSTLAGPLGFPAGGLFTTSFGTFTGGTLLDYVDTGSLVLSMNFTSVLTTPAGPNGFAVNPPPPPFNPQLPPPPPYNATLLPFTANSSINIDAAPAIPEPATATLAFVAAALGVNAVRRRRAS